MDITFLNICPESLASGLPVVRPTGGVPAVNAAAQFTHTGMFRVSGEAEDHEERTETDNECARDSNVGISSMESSRRRREANVAQSAFLAETSDIDEGPIGLYRKGLHDHVFRPVRDLLSLTRL